MATAIYNAVLFNTRIGGVVNNLENRFNAIENSNVSSEDGVRSNVTATRTVQPAVSHRKKDARSRSPSPDGRDYRDRTKKPRKTLQIQIPGNIYVPPATGLATPMSNPMVDPDATEALSVTLTAM